MHGGDEADGVKSGRRRTMKSMVENETVLYIDENQAEQRGGVFFVLRPGSRFLDM